MYHCFDDYNTANGFQGRIILFNRTTLSPAAEKQTNSSPKNANPLRAKKFRGIHESASTYRPVPQFKIVSSQN
jgi:hypothetical protein